MIFLSACRLSLWMVGRLFLLSENKYVEGVIKIRLFKA